MIWKPYIHYVWDGTPFPKPAPGAEPSDVFKQCAFSYPEGNQCFYIDEDEAIVVEHYMKSHSEDGQAILEGRRMTEDDRRAAILAALPNEDVVCPFCFSGQKAVATRFFLDDGKLSNMAKCCVCKKRMRADSMRQIRGGPRDFGRWVGAYPRFWGMVEHDAWLKKLKATYAPLQSLKWDDPNQPLSLFWAGYGDSRPEFALKQKIAQQQREYEKQSGEDVKE